LKRTVASMLAQEYPAEAYEILLVDNGSTDGSAELAGQWERVKVLREEKRGSYAARNRGVAEASGEILAFADADRVVGRGWLRAIERGMAETRAAVLLGRSRPMVEGGLLGALWDYENEKAQYACEMGTRRQQVAYTGNMAVRREAFEKYGPFEEMMRGGDVVFVRRVLEGEGLGAVAYRADMEDRHQEMGGVGDYFAKMAIYGRSIQNYRGVIACDPMGLDDRVRIFLRCADRRGYTGWEALRLLGGLAAGQAAYAYGQWRGGLGREAETGRGAGVVRGDWQGRATVVVEWENVILAGDERGEEALRRVARQAAGRGGVDLVVVYHPAEVQGEALRELVARVAGGEGVAWRVVAGEVADYYELKNAGAEAATGDVVVFSDSDTCVEEGWLAGLLGPFADAGVQAVCGSSYIETGSFYGRAFASFWFFPPRVGEARIERAKGIFANNFAVRREVFLARPFRPVAGTNRGACVLWRERMLADGMTVVQNTAARTEHPAPNGLRHTFVRAMTHGRDFVLMAREQGRRLEAGLFGTLGRYGLNLLRTVHGARRLRWWEMAPAAAIGVGYYTTYLAGEVLTRVAPGWMIRRFRV
jgi:GT2 family glycosyltransferase